MFSKHCSKRGSTALVLFAALAAGGCGTTAKKTTIYTPTLEDTRDLSRPQAEKLLLNALQSENTCGGPKSVRLASEQLTFMCKKNGWTRAYRFADTAFPKVSQHSVGSFTYYCINAEPIPSRSIDPPSSPAAGKSTRSWPMPGSAG